MKRSLRRAQSRADQKVSRAFIAALPETLTRVPDEELAGRWPFGTLGPIEAWRSRHFVVQVFRANPRELKAGVIERVGVLRTNKADGILWDELYAIKGQIGRGHLAAVELYPPAASVVAVANMRWLWVLAEPPAWMWNRAVEHVDEPET